MSPHIVEESRFLLSSFLLGIGITAVYDSLRIFRRVYSHRLFWISAEDLLYWVFVSCSVFYLLYYENNGAFRWFAVLGMITGMLLYNRTVSPFLVQWLSRFLLWLRRLLHKWNAFLTKPLRRAGRAARKQGAVLSRKAGRLGRIAKKQLTVSARMVKLMVWSRRKRIQRGRKNG